MLHEEMGTRILCLDLFLQGLCLKFYVQLQSKYEVLIRRVQIEEGGERSANYYILKLAQERETIQREGKNLQAEIDKVCY